MTGPDLDSLFKQMLEECQGIVLKIARAYTVTPNDRQDLVQEILLQVWRSLPSFQGQASHSTWIYRVALNTAISFRRKESRRNDHHQSLIDLAETPHHEIPSSHQTDQNELIEHLYSAIRQLPKPAAALALLYLDNLSYCQIGEVLGISESHVGVKLNRLKRTLSELLKEGFDGP